MGRVLASGSVVGLAHHTVLIGRDGDERPIDDSGAPIRNNRNAVVGVVIVFRDVTERRLSEQELLETAGARTSSSPCSRTSCATPWPPSPTPSNSSSGPRPRFLDWCKEVIDRQVKQLTRLVDDLLDVSRITRGKIQLRPLRIDLATVLRASAESVRPLIVERNHDFHVAIEPEPFWIEADPTRLEQVFVNLLTNAAKYTESGGRIDLDARLG